MKLILLSVLLLLAGLISGCHANPNSGFGLVYTPGSGGGSTGTTGPSIGHVTLKLNLVSGFSKGVYIWVTTASNTYVNTIQRYSGGGNGKANNNPTNWHQFAGASSLDGVTTATVNGNAAYSSVSWNCKNKAGTDIPYGTYKIWMEICQNTSPIQTKEYSGTILITSNSNTTGLMLPLDAVMAAGTNQWTTN